MPTAIKIENLSKKYFIRHKKSARYITLGESISNQIKQFRKSFFSRGDKKRRIGKTSSFEEFFAVEDINLDIKKGDCIGIIGPNGAGKTTLLKIISRITEPTKGRISIKGSVSSLLEVGTGFHPELTGRENIYLNGAIIGMKKREIDRKFDEIVTFANVEKFIDTPMKYYSSGMYVRLAFAVAAHLESEIILVDEVLAVGDIAFQKKCLGKIGDVYKTGRTVLFVSHNLQAVNQLCSRTVLLNEGKIVKDGGTKEVLEAYIALMFNTDSLTGDLSSQKLRLSISKPDSLFKWKNIKILNSNKQKTQEIKFNEPFEVVFQGFASQGCEKIVVGFGIYSGMAGYIFTSHQIYNGLPDSLPEGISEFRIEIKPNLLAPGFYEIGVAAEGPDVGDWVPAAIELHVLDLGITPDRYWHLPYQGGMIDYPCKWSFKAPV